MVTRSVEKWVGISTVIGTMEGSCCSASTPPRRFWPDWSCEVPLRRASGSSGDTVIKHGDNDEGPKDAVKGSFPTERGILACLHYLALVPFRSKEHKHDGSKILCNPE